MESLLQTFQQVVDSGREDPYGAGVGPGLGAGDTEAQLNNLPSNARELKRLVVARQLAYDTLLEESQELQQQLAHTSKRLSSQRDLWMASLSSQEQTILTLIEVASRSESFGTATNPTVAPRTVEDGDPPALLKDVFVNSLLEQIEMLKAALTDATTERDTAQLSLDRHVQEQLQRTAPADRAAEHHEAMRKLNAFWDEERENYERQLDHLTRAAEKGTDSLELLAQRHNGEMETLAAAKRAYMENLAALRADAASQSVQPPASSSSAGEEAGTSAPTSIPLTTASHPTEPPAPGVSERVAAAREETLERLNGEMEDLKKALELTQQECRAREDAVSAMYEDNKRLEGDRGRLIDELAIYRDETHRHESDSGSLQQRLIEEHASGRALKSALDAAQLAQEQLLRDVAALRGAIPPSAPFRGGPALSGSVIACAAAQPAVVAVPIVAHHPASASKRAKDFVASAAAKLRNSKAASGARRFTALHLIIAAVVAMTIISLVVFSVSGNALPGAQHSSTAMEHMLRTRLADCERRLDQQPAGGAP